MPRGVFRRIDETIAAIPSRTRDGEIVNEANILYALKLIGNDERLRREAIEFLKQIEAQISYAGRSIRDEVTGPLLDAMLDENTVLHKTLC